MLYDCSRVIVSNRENHVGSLSPQSSPKKSKSEAHPKKANKSPTGIASALYPFLSKTHRGIPVFAKTYRRIPLLPKPIEPYPFCQNPQRYTLFCQNPLRHTLFCQNPQRHTLFCHHPSANISPCLCACCRVRNVINTGPNHTPYQQVINAKYGRPR